MLVRLQVIIKTHLEMTEASFWINVVVFLIGTLGGSFTRVYDMNDFGQVVGESESSNISLVDEKKEQHAFLWQCGFMSDLGSLTGDLGMPGDRSQATGINNRGQIIGTSNSLIAHKRKFLRTNNRAVVWQNGVIEEIDSTLDLECSAVATSVNNAGVATFGHNKYGHFAVDLAEKRKILFSINNFGLPFEVTDDKDIFIIHPASTGVSAIYLGFLKKDDSKEYCFDGDFYTYIYFSSELDSQSQWKPNSFIGTYFNNKRWIVGTAANIYSERHAVLLVPIKESKNGESETSTENEERNLEFEDQNEFNTILIKYLNNPEHLTPFHYAVKEGDNRAIEIMINHSVDVNLIDGGYTPLHRAIEANHLETVALLVQYGANINACDGQGYIPLHRAILADQFDTAIFLLQHGADAEATVRKGLAEFRCIDLARQYGSPDLNMLFIDKEILILEEKCRQHLIEANLKKMGPIELAFQKSELELAEYLFQTRERDLALNKETFEFPGYEFCTTPLTNPVWQKPTPIKYKGGNGIYVGMLNRVDCDALKTLMKFDMNNLWKKYIVDWMSRSYHLGDLETIAFLYPLAKKANISIGFKQGEQRYLIDPFLSDIPIDLENPSHFYIPGLGRKIPPSLFEYRSDDNAHIKELKKQIQDLFNV